MPEEITPESKKTVQRIENLLKSPNGAAKASRRLSDEFFEYACSHQNPKQQEKYWQDVITALTKDKVIGQLSLSLDPSKEIMRHNIDFLRQSPDGKLDGSLFGTISGGEGCLDRQALGKYIELATLKRKTGEDKGNYSPECLAFAKGLMDNWDKPYGLSLRTKDGPNIRDYISYDYDLLHAGDYRFDNVSPESYFKLRSTEWDSAYQEGKALDYLFGIPAHSYGAHELDDKAIKQLAKGRPDLLKARDPIIDNVKPEQQFLLIPYKDKKDGRIKAQYATNLSKEVLGMLKEQDNEKGGPFREAQIIYDNFDKIAGKAPKTADPHNESKGPNNKIELPSISQDDALYRHRQIEQSMFILALPDLAAGKLSKEHYKQLQSTLDTRFQFPHDAKEFVDTVNKRLKNSGSSLSIRMKPVEASPHEIGQELYINIYRNKKVVASFSPIEQM